MTANARLLPGLVAPLLALTLVACTGDDDPDGQDDVAAVVSEEAGQAALLTADDLGAGYRAQAPDEAGDNEGIDCLSSAARDFDAVEGDTDLEVEYRKSGPADTAAEVSVLSGFSSYSDAARPEVALDALWEAMLACGTAEYEQDDSKISFDITVSDGRSTDVIDQQVNVLLDGEISVGDIVLPLVIQLRYFRIGNHAATISVSLLNSPDQASEVDRLVGLGVDRFVDVATSSG